VELNQSVESGDFMASTGHLCPTLLNAGTIKAGLKGTPSSTLQTLYKYLSVKITFNLYNIYTTVTNILKISRQPITNFKVTWRY